MSIANEKSNSIKDDHEKRDILTLQRALKLAINRNELEFVENLKALLNQLNGGLKRTYSIDQHQYRDFKAKRDTNLKKLKELNKEAKNIMPTNLDVFIAIEAALEKTTKAMPSPKEFIKAQRKIDRPLERILSKYLTGRSLSDAKTNDQKVYEARLLIENDIRVRLQKTITEGEIAKLEKMLFAFYKRGKKAWRSETKIADAVSKILKSRRNNRQIK